MEVCLDVKGNAMYVSDSVFGILGGLGARVPRAAVSGFFRDQPWHWRPSHFPPGYYGTHRTDHTYLMSR